MAISFSLTPAKAPVVRAPLNRNYWLLVLRRVRRDPVAVIAALAIFLIVVAALFAPWLAPADPYKGSMIHRLLHIGSPGSLLGTDELGRDMITRLMYGGRLSLLMGVLPVLFVWILISAAAGSPDIAAALSFVFICVLATRIGYGGRG